MDNHFNSKGGEQNTGIGDHAIGKQVNYYNTPPPVMPRYLPPLDTCFLGRDKELAKLLEQLQPGKVAAVCGPGGMGKSALAAQAVSKLEATRFPDGIISHSFYHQPSTDMALQTICNAFQVEAKAGLASTVRQVLAGRKALLILDGAEEADDLPAVLALRSTCGVLITSRKRADAQGFRLDLKPLEEQPAAAVFCEHSGAAANDESVAGICTILGGWPVGLRIAGRYCSSTGESAAGYLRWLAQEPFKELGDGEHQEENAALLLRCSVAQVSDDARLALGVAGTLAFAPIAFEPVAATLSGSSVVPSQGFWTRVKTVFSLRSEPLGKYSAEDEQRARAVLGKLVNYGLMETKEERWQISHALVHTYARTELPLNKESLEQLAWYYICFCLDQNEAGLIGYACLDGERAHCLRLMESCIASRLWQRAQEVAIVINKYLYRQGWWRDWAAALAMRLIAARQTGDRKDEIICLNELGYIYHQRDEHEKALVLYEQSLSICRELRELEGEGKNLDNIGSIYADQGKNDLAIEYYKQSLTIQQKIGDRKGESATLNNIGLIYYTQGDYEQALRYYEQCLPITQMVGNDITEGTVLANIGLIYYAQGNYTQALKYQKQALSIERENGFRAKEAQTCWNIGVICIDLRDFAKMEKYMSQAVQIAETVGHPNLEAWREDLAKVRTTRQG